MAGLQAQWFPLYPAASAVFQLDGAPSSRAGSQARCTITLDTFPYLVYGLRFDTSYELPLEFFEDNPAFKMNMALGKVDDDFDVEIQLTQGNVTSIERSHVRNLQGSNGFNRHPWPLPYPMRGGNKISITAIRNSSYPRILVNDVEVPLAITLKVSAETARGVRNVADGITTPAPPPSTGYP